MLFNRDLFREHEFLSYVSHRPHCSTNDHETFDQPEDHSISCTPSTSKLIPSTSAASEEIEHDCISYPITPEDILRYHSALNQEKNHPAEEKSKNLKF